VLPSDRSGHARAVRVGDRERDVDGDRADGKLYCSSRFEGAVYRVAPDGTPERVASDLGVACGIAFDEDGWMFVGDRSGTFSRARRPRLRVCGAAAKRGCVSSRNESRRGAARHGTDAWDLRSDSTNSIAAADHDHRFVARPPQGITFGPDGKLYVIDALAGSSGLHRLEPDGSFTAIVAAEPRRCRVRARRGARRRVERNRVSLRLESFAGLRGVWRGLIPPHVAAVCPQTY
jgi:sugar lactone lactonase YvrE